jgi:hypothetical protein
MMKRCMVLLVAMLLLVGGVPAMGEASDQAQMIDRLTQVVEEMLQEEGYLYTYDAEDECFDLEFSLDSALTSTSVTIYIYDDMVSVVADSPLTVAPEYRDNMAKFLTLVNSGIYYGQFRMNYETGRVSCRSYQIVEEVVPGPREISVLLAMPVDYMGSYGDGIAQISVSGADPDAAYQAALD